MISGSSAEELLTLREAARRLDVHENTLRNWVKRGVLEPVKVPGTRYRRFRADDIDRVVRQQDRSLAASPRVEAATEFVDAAYLDTWAITRDAQALLPGVVRRLIAGTAGVIGLSMRAGDGVGDAGWDGLIEDSPGSPWVPVGSSAWELGTGGDPARKAQAEYTKRTAEPLGVDPGVTTFVFVTPRRWPRARDWERERRDEKTWKHIRVIDGDDLQGWLESQPAVHLWLSERLGLRPRDVQTLEDWWAQFSAKTRPQLPRELLLAGRQHSATQLRAAATSKAPTAIYVRGGSREEAAAFVAAVLFSAEERGGPAMVGLTPQGWERLTMGSEAAVLIPDFDDPNIAPAVGRGHLVVVPLQERGSVQGLNVIELGTLERTEARDTLVEKAGLPFREADRLAGLARRSLAAFMRDPALASAPRSSPAWARGNHARLLGRLTLVGEWSPSDRDHDAIAEAVGRDWEAVEDELVSWHTSSDPPFVLAGDRWQVTSADGAWSLLHDAVQAGDIQRICNVAAAVLSETDPLLDLVPDERSLASVRGIRPIYSGTIRAGLAQGLALLGAFNEPLPGGAAGRDYADATVRELLRRANHDPSARLWASLSPQLQLLAEAAPEEFLNGVEAGLVGNQPVLALMFTDHEKTEAFGSTSPHTGLLWALELLCWSPEFSRAAGALARLAEVDPGGRSGNRPIGSLRSVFLPWIPQTAASLESRIRVLDRLRSDHSDVAWDLELAIMPAGHDFSTYTPRPRFRGWDTNDERPPLHEWLAAITEITSRAIEDAGTNPIRWTALLQHIGDLPDAQRDAVIAGLDSVSPLAMESAGRSRLWETMIEFIERHRQFPDARWALADAPLARLEDIVGRLAPGDLVTRHVRLFDWHPHLAGIDPADYEGHQIALTELRAEAVRGILEASGMRGIERLALESKMPEEVGSQLAGVSRDREFPRVRELLGQPDSSGRLADGWVARMAHDAEPGWWLRMAAEMPGWPEETQVAFLRGLGAPTPRLLEFLNQLDGNVQEKYWRTTRPFAIDRSVLATVVDKLLVHDRPWAAIDVLATSRHRASDDGLPKQPMVDAVVAALKAAVANPGDRPQAASAGYEVGQLLDYLDRQAVQEDTVAELEWSFFRLLEYTREPRALYARLARNPEFFVELISVLYRPKNGPSERESDDTATAVASNAWSVLTHWREPPGLTSERKIDSQQLRGWVRRARLLLMDADRADVGDHHIGQLLSGAPPGTDGIRPAEEVRELIEDLASTAIETGFVIGVLNSRGITSRGMYDGGTQEWGIAKEYRNSAAEIIDQWPRTGRLLNELAADFERTARREDAEEQARAGNV
jgi:excisionase family DNA binding protein